MTAGTLARPWRRLPHRSAAWTVAGAVLTVERKGTRWEAKVEPPEGLWPAEPSTSPPMIGRSQAEEWAERIARSRDDC